MGFLDFLSSFWLYLILSIFIVRWIFNLLSRKDALSKRENSILQRDRLTSEKEKALSVREERFQSYMDSQHAELAQNRHHLNDLVRTRTIETVRGISGREYLRSTPAFEALHGEPFPYKRLSSALTQSFQISIPFDITASIRSESGESYSTTLYHCSCPDYRSRKQPCKHMIRLAIEVGTLMSFDTSSLQAEVSSLIAQRENNLKDINAAQEALLDETKKCDEIMRRASKIQTELDLIYNERIQSYPFLAKLYADLYQTYDKNWILYLRNKNRPAEQKAADVGKIINGELRDWRMQAKQYEYQLHFYESMFPWLLDFKELPPLEAFRYVSNSESPSDEVELFKNELSPIEWSTLPDAEKYQLALDRYIVRKKSNWEVGIEYERYIGYLCESRGYRVHFYGATMKKEDMGRDLILERGNKTILIQCKRWAKEKVIHENHVFQLAGSVYEYQYMHPEREVIGVFVTTIDLSPVASRCAERLGISVYPSTPFCEYPRIKCNIGRDGSKIFHLPMDQQYDNVQICEPGEFYAKTVEEAMSHGFRRAYRWHGSKE